MEGRYVDENGKQLDFGWFKMPPSQGMAPTGGGEPTSMAMGEFPAVDGACGSLPMPNPDFHDAADEHQNQQRPMSNADQRPPSNAGQMSQRPPSNAGQMSQRPPSNTGQMSQRPPSNAGQISQRPPSNAGQMSQRPPSNTGQMSQRPPSNAGQMSQRPPSNAGQMSQRPPSNAGRAMSQANYCSAEEAEMAYNRINESGCYGPPPPTQTYDENIVIDWPLFHVGEEETQTQRFAHSVEERKQQSCDQRPFSSSNRLETPLPPVSLQGYGQDRPTYATWRDRFHKEQQRSLDTTNNNDNNNSNGTCPSAESAGIDAMTTDLYTIDPWNRFSGDNINIGTSSSPGMELDNEDAGNVDPFHDVKGCHNAVVYTNEVKSLPQELTLSSLSAEEDNDEVKRPSLRQVITNKLKRIVHWPGYQKTKMTYHKYDKLNL